MTNQTEQNKEHREHKKLEDLLKETIARTIDMWCSGEGDLLIEVRDDGGDKRAKLKGGHTSRIK